MIMAWSSRVKPVARGAPTYIVRSAATTQRYESYGNRYLRSLGLSVRLSSGGGGGVICSGSCQEGVEYGTPGEIKTLTYQFAGSDPVTIFTGEAWIKFTTATSEKSQAGTRDVMYLVSMSRNIRRNFGGGCSSLISLDNYRGYFGDEDDFYVYGPLRSEVNVIGGDSCNTFGFEWRLYHHTTNPWVDEAIFDCGDATNFLIEDPDTEYELWTQYDVFEPNAGYNIDYSNQDLLSTYSPTFIPCSGVDPPPTLTRGITISDPTGVIHVGSALPGVTSLPSISIEESGEGSTYLVESATFPSTWYTVPLTFSSCDCADFTQKVSTPPVPAIRPSYFRDWSGSAAGPFNPCKHIMAVGRVLRIPQNYSDYKPSRRGILRLSLRRQFEVTMAQRRQDIADFNNAFYTVGDWLNNVRFGGGNDYEVPPYSIKSRPKKPKKKRVKPKIKKGYIPKRKGFR